MTLTPKEFVKEYGIRSLVCCFSGGKSSLAMTHYVMSELRKINSPELEKIVVFVDTGVMLPPAREFVEKVSKRYRWFLKVLHPKLDFWSCAARWGTPSIKRRWCCKTLKLQPIFDFIKTLPYQRADLVGFRKDETAERRRKLPEVRYLKRIRSWVYYPIKNWTKKDVMDYIREHNLPMPPWYRMGLKETCICGAYAHKKEWMIIKAHFPELFQRFVELEKHRLKWGRTVFYDKGPLSALELSKQKTLTEMMKQKYRGRTPVEREDDSTHLQDGCSSTTFTAKQQKLNQ